MSDTEIVVIGAGTVGSAIAYGLARRGVRTLVLDGPSNDFRAARANFGLVWVQGKGAGMPAYQALTRTSSNAWPEFESELRDHADQKTLEYERRGGLVYCLGDAEFQARRDALERLDNQAGAGDHDVEMVDRADLEKLLPAARLGPDVVGGSYCWRDGHTNPLLLLHALHNGLRRLGAEILADRPVTSISAGDGGFTVETREKRYTGDKVVIAAGLGSRDLARQVGLDLPIRPERGQILVTRRVAPMLDLPASGLRQTGDGTILIGATKEDAGHDVTTSVEKATTLARKAVRILPDLANVELVRQWAGLRILTPDSYPIYVESETAPGSFVAVCHSGVTLAAMHAHILAPHIAEGRLPSALEPFHHGQFDV